VTDTQSITFTWFIDQIVKFIQTLTSGFTSMFSSLFNDTNKHNVTVVINGTGINKTFTWYVNLTNVAPMMNSVFINSTYGANSTYENLTAYWNSSDYNNDSIYNITDWRINGISYAKLNLPFEGNGTNNASDYSTNLFGVYVGTTGPLWNRSGGHDGGGAYRFNSNRNTDSLYAYTLDYSKFANVSDGTKTISFWVNTAVHNGVIMGTLYPNCVWNSSGWFISLNFMVGGSKIEFSWLNSTFSRNASTCGTYSSVGSNAGIGVSKWVHAVVSFNTTNIVFYINGTLDRNYINTMGVLASKNEVSPAYTVPQLYIGNTVLSNFYPFNGTIDDIMFFNRTLSPEEINEIYKNRTLNIVSQELQPGENWSACVTPNDGYVNGNTVCSNNITIGTSYWGGSTFNLPCNTAGGSYGFGHNLAGNLFNISGSGEALSLYGRIWNYSGLTITNCRVYLYNNATG